MSRKNILLIIIVVVLAIAGFIVYRSFSAEAPAPVTPIVVTPGPGGATTAVPAASSGKILPLGTRFDLTLVKKYNADGKIFNYPKVEPGEVGPVLGDIIKKIQ